MAVKPPVTPVSEMADSLTSWLFPGQGSQYLGMGRELWSQPGRPLDIVTEAEQISGFPLRQISLLGPTEELIRTDVLQPTLTALALGCVHVLNDSGFHPSMVAGHSLGEFAALSAAGVLGVTDCLRLVSERGRLMHNIARRLNGGMGAVKHLSQEMLEQVLAEHAPLVTIANWNSLAQIVVSGPLSALSNLSPSVAAAGGEFVMLPVAGPWHHPSMQEAAAEFRQLISETSFLTPRCPVYMNVSATAETSPAQIQGLLCAQMTTPVLWQATIEAMFAAGARFFLEVGPGKVLRGLLRQIIPAESTYRVRAIENQRGLQFLAKETAVCC